MKTTLTLNMKKKTIEMTKTVAASASLELKHTTISSRLVAIILITP